MLRTAGEGQTRGVGVIVGRFQTPDLHAGHREVIQSVIDRHPQTLIILGLSPLRATKVNPLDYESRRQMILQEFPGVQVAYHPDSPDDRQWVRSLDKLIDRCCPPDSAKTVYGSRSSFLTTYREHQGVYPSVELIPNTIVSATDQRELAGYKPKATQDFRHGAVWATQNRYDTVHPTVDIAVLHRGDSGKVDRILLANKREDGTRLRFIGGFVTAQGREGHTVEDNALREAREETGGCEYGNPVYIGSFVVDDWRYRPERDKIVTMLYTADLLFGSPTPSDDVDGLAWIDTTQDFWTNPSFLENMVIPEHKALARFLQQYLISKGLLARK